MSCKLPVVIVDRDMSRPFDCVMHDHHAGVAQAMEFLLTLGHRRIALFISSSTLRPGREKHNGYISALLAAGLPYDDALVCLADSWLDSSHLRMARMLELDRPPTAIIAFGTRLLSGAVRVAREAGLEIPRDLSVIGMGTLETLELMYPPVTALRYNYELSAQVTVQLMMDRIHNGGSEPPRRIPIAWELVMGASCAPVMAR